MPTIGKVTADTIKLVHNRDELNRVQDNKLQL
jgi:hypothetical protein